MDPVSKKAWDQQQPMIDSFSLLLSHMLLLLMMWRLLSRDDIDVETPAAEERRLAAEELGDEQGPQAGGNGAGWLKPRGERAPGAATRKKPVSRLPGWNRRDA